MDKCDQCGKSKFSRVHFQGEHYDHPYIYNGPVAMSEAAKWKAKADKLAKALEEMQIEFIDLCNKADMMCDWQAETINRSRATLAEYHS